jgi:hypothetical protein
VILLAVLLSLVTPIMRMAARFGGAPAQPQVELEVQSYYFIFQLIQAFLVVTLASAATTVAKQIADNPSSATNLLATNLPKASNFYIAYFILQGLIISSKQLVQLIPLVLRTILSKLLDKTPRKIYKRWSSLPDLKWGSVFPPFTVLLVIGKCSFYEVSRGTLTDVHILAITYSCIAPLILGFATIGFYLVYLAFRYNLLFVNNATIDCKGLTYPKALQQTFAGMYLAEICLIGLFSIQAAPGPIIIEVVLLVFTILFHMKLAQALNPLIHNLPKSLAPEEDALLALETGHTSEATKSTNGGTVLQPSADAALGPRKRPNLVAKWLRPDRHTDYHTLRRLVPKDVSHISYSAEAERDAYYDPAIGSPTPLLWIPRDPLGISRQEVAHSSKVIPMTDEGAFLDEKNKVQIDETIVPPIHEEKAYY